MKNSIRKFLENTGSTVLDVISAFLLCFAAGLVVLYAMSQEAGVWQCALYAACAVLFCLLFSVKQAAIALLIGIPVLSVMGYIIVLLRFEQAHAYVMGFIRWCMDGFVKTEPYSFDFSTHLVRFAILVPIAAASYLFFRKLYALIPLLVIGAGLTVYAQYYRMEQRYALFAALLVLLLMALSHTTHRAVRKRLKRGVILPEAAMRAAALVFGTVAVLLSVSLASAPDGVWKSQPLHHFVSDVSDFVRYHFQGESVSSGFSIGWSGYSPLGDRLGGDIHPDQAVVIRVRTDSPSLLMGSVYDSYDGQHWYDSGTLGNFRMNSLWWRNRRRETFALSNPRGGRKAQERYDEITTVAETMLTPNLLYRNYFTAGSPLSWELSPSCGEVYFNTQGETYMLEEPAAGATYTVRSRIFNTGAPDFERGLLALETVTLSQKDPYYEDILAVYGALPESLPQSVYDMAFAISEEARTPAEKAFAIEKWIRENCSYTTTPGPVEEGRDFVDFFLETRRGYCTYYASAMTVMARCVGLPARYVTGYGLQKTPDRYTDTTSFYNYLATNESAHAWSEVYLSGIGWVPFDAADYQIRQYNRVRRETQLKKELQLAGSRWGNGIEEENPSDIQSGGTLPGTDRQEEEMRTRRNWLLAFLTAAALVFIWLAVRSRWLSAGAEELRVRTGRFHKTREEQADALFKRISDQLGYVGMFPLSGETLRAFSQRVSAVLGDTENTEAAFLGIERLYYGLREPAEEDILALARLSVRAENEIREVLGERTYFWQRLVFAYYPQKIWRGFRKKLQ